MKVDYLQCLPMQVTGEVQLSIYTQRNYTRDPYGKISPVYWSMKMASSRLRSNQTCQDCSINETLYRQLIRNSSWKKISTSTSLANDRKNYVKRATNS